MTAPLPGVGANSAAGCCGSGAASSRSAPAAKTSALKAQLLARGRRRPRARAGPARRIGSRARVPRRAPGSSGCESATSADSRREIPASIRRPSSRKPTSGLVLDVHDREILRRRGLARTHFGKRQRGLAQSSGSRMVGSALGPRDRRFGMPVSWPDRVAWRGLPPLPPREHGDEQRPEKQQRPTQLRHRHAPPASDRREPHGLVDVDRHQARHARLVHGHADAAARRAPWWSCCE